MRIRIKFEKSEDFCAAVGAIVEAREE